LLEPKTREPIFQALYQIELGWKKLIAKDLAKVNWAERLPFGNWEKARQLRGGTQWPVSPVGSGRRVAPAEARTMHKATDTSISHHKRQTQLHSRAATRHLLAAQPKLKAHCAKCIG